MSRIKKEDEVGGGLKGLTRFLFWVDGIGTLLGCLYFLTNTVEDYYGELEWFKEDDFLAIVVLISGALVFAGLMYLYGFSQMVEDVAVIRSHLEIMNETKQADNIEEQPQEKTQVTDLHQRNERVQLTDIKKIGECTLCGRKGVMVTKGVYIADEEKMDCYICQNCLNK